MAYLGQYFYATRRNSNRQREVLYNMADVIKEHKELFENWLNSTRKNSTLINRNDLESISEVI